MGIDTWGVDFVLLDGEGHRLGDAVGYRDGRTAGMDTLVYEQIPEQRSCMKEQGYRSRYLIRYISWRR